FVRIKYEYATKVIPKKLWRDFIYGMLMGDKTCYPAVIECDLRSVSGSKCFGYRLTPEYPKVRRIVCTHDAINHRITSIQREEERPLIPIHRWLAGWLNHLRLDGKAAKRLVAKMTPEEETARWVWRDGRSHWRQPPTVEEYREIIWGQVQR